MHYIPEVSSPIMAMNNGKVVLPGDPAGNRRPSGSGPEGEKWAIERMVKGNQVSCAKWATGPGAFCIRNRQRLGTWNVRGLAQHPDKLHIIEREMEAHKISILGLSETHWRGKGHFRSSTGIMVYFSGHDERGQTESR